MMDSLAALHHAIAYESANDSGYNDTEQDDTEQDGTEQNRAERSAKNPIQRLFCFGISMASFGLAHQAMALQAGDSGDEVADLQSRLAELNYYTGPVTGIYGDLTIAAVTRFQEDNLLMVDGIAERETLAVLRERENLTPIVTPMITPNLVIDGMTVVAPVETVVTPVETIVTPVQTVITPVETIIVNDRGNEIGSSAIGAEDTILTKGLNLIDCGATSCDR